MVTSGKNGSISALVYWALFTPGMVLRPALDQLMNVQVLDGLVVKAHHGEAMGPPVAVSTVVVERGQ